MPRMIATVEMMYDEGADPKQVHDLLFNALEHCRQENMLSDPEDDEVSCGWIDVIAVEETMP